MKKILISFLLMFSCLTYSQNIEGKWKSIQSINQGMEFTKDGKFNLLDLENLSNQVLKNITIKYELKSIEKIDYIEFTYYSNNTVQGKEFVKYRIEKNKLFLQDKTDDIHNIASQVVIKTEEVFVKIK